MTVVPKINTLLFLAKFPRAEVIYDFSVSFRLISSLYENKLKREGKSKKVTKIELLKEINILNVLCHTISSFFPESTLITWICLNSVFKGIIGCYLIKPD